MKTPSTLPIMTWSLLVVFAGCIAVSCGQICQRPAVKPNIADFTLQTRDRFQMDVEVYEKEKNKVTAVKMRYDTYYQIIHLTSHSNGSKTDVYYYYRDNEILLFQPNEQGGRVNEYLAFKDSIDLVPNNVSAPNRLLVLSYVLCVDVDQESCIVVNDLTTHHYTFIVGGFVRNKTGSNVLIPPAPSFFHFAGQDAAQQEIFQKHAGNDTVRGKKVTVFTSCQKWMSWMTDQLFDANVTHKFLSPDWRYPRPDDNMFTVPMEMRVTGTLNGQTIDHTYSYFNFKVEIDDFALETPTGIACPGRKVDKPFPALPDQFNYVIEVVDTLSGSFYTFQEIYSDNWNNLAVYKESVAANTFNDSSRIVYVNDFSTGLSFKVDETLQTCVVKNISDSDFPLSIRDKNGNSVPLTPSQAFYKDRSNFTYLGERTVRGIVTDTWVAEGNSVVLEDYFSTVEWYFAVPFTSTWNDKVSTPHPIPVLCKMWIKPYLDTDPINNRIFTMSVFNVDYTPILFDTIDIKACMPGSASNHFQLIFPGAKDNLTNCDIQDFKTELQGMIAFIGGVRFYRVTGFEFLYILQDLVVQFEILSAARIKGDVENPIVQSSLESATLSIKTLVENGNFFFTIGCRNQTITADPKAVINPSKPVSSIPSSQDVPADNGIQPVMQYDEEEGLLEPAPPSDEEAGGHELGSWTVVGIAVFVVGMATGGGGSYYMAARTGL